MNRHARVRSSARLSTGPHDSESCEGYALHVAGEKEQKITRKRRGHVTNLLGLALAAAVLLTVFCLHHEQPTITQEAIEPKTPILQSLNSTSKSIDASAGSNVKLPYTMPSAVEVAKDKKVPQNLKKFMNPDDHDVSNDLLQHPHAGARFPNGTRGLVINPSPEILTNIMPTRDTQCQIDDKTEEAQTITYNVARMVRTGVKKVNNSNKSPRILCMVYTHSGSHSRVQAIVNTWGSKCDGFFVASNMTDLSIGAINLLHKGPEVYTNMWQKVRSMWSYAHDHYLEDYDYFHISGDDSFVVMDNMKAFLNGDQINRLLNGHLDTFSKRYQAAKRWEMERPRPLVLGTPLLFKNSVFPQGGGGYTLNREAVRLMVEEGGPLDTNLNDSVDSREDVFIAVMMAAFGTYVSDTRDKTGAFRYICYEPRQVYHGNGKYPDRYNITVHSKYDRFSNETVAMHLRGMDRILPMEEIIYRMNDMLSGKCDNEFF